MPIHPPATPWYGQPLEEPRYEPSALQGGVLDASGGEFQTLDTSGEPYVYGWYYDENGNLINGETGETFWDTDFETQDLFYRDVLASVGLTGDLGQSNIEVATEETSPEVAALQSLAAQWVGSEELYTWVLAQSQANWENGVVEAIGPRNVDDSRRPHRTEVAPWDGPEDAVPTPRIVSSEVAEAPVPYPDIVPTSPLPEETDTDYEDSYLPSPEESGRFVRQEFTPPSGSYTPFPLSRQIAGLSPTLSQVEPEKPYRPTARERQENLYKLDMSLAQNPNPADRILVRGAPHHRPPARKEMPPWMLSEAYGIR